MTPYEALNKQVPDISYLRVIGSKAWMLILKDIRDHKFMPRAKIYRLLGYVSSGQLIFWDEFDDLVIYIRYVSINEYDDIKQ
jgi:hypothetical protein